MDISFRFQIRTAVDTDQPAILALVQQCALPLEGLDTLRNTTIVALDGEKIIGTAALELYTDGALLRSVAVDPDHRDLHIGHAMVEAALEKARTQELPAIYLLTTTAEAFFPRFGFTVTSRAQVPDSVQQSVEFRSACPASATVMMRAL